MCFLYIPTIFRSSGFFLPNIFFLAFSSIFDVAKNDKNILVLKSEQLPSFFDSINFWQLSDGVSESDCCARKKLSPGLF